MNSSFLYSRIGEMVTFLVGPPGYSERMDANISKLCKVSPVFNAMLRGPMRESDQFVRIEDTDSRGFACFITWIQDSRLVLRSVPTALSVLYLSHKYMVPEILEPVLQYILCNVNEDTVLQVLQTILLYYRPPGLPSAPSLPPAPSLQACEPSSPSPSPPSPPPPSLPPQQHDLYEKVFAVCLTTFDRSASRILESEEVEDLSRDLLVLLLSRSSLRIQSEIEIARAVERWGSVQARRSGYTRAQVLGDTTYLIRFLTMSAQEFKRGVAGTGLLSTQEEQSLLFCLIRPGAWLPPQLDGIRGVLSTPRRWRDRNRAWFTIKQKNQLQVKPTCRDIGERRFTAVEKVFLCLACIFD
ncbi:BTB/POZ domain-containing protein 3 [Eurytemora carolleeae]|uniref:BTB/POZ domain-containing protein 3 n=1 Tax=Eurytemora carolleeae TaxID=1294199 RepID=UPI000C756EB2|nr:BTB/POZ domain-containing protein 3 [Eurytemora carolleeae]|eukprot:XP_023325847.1 BTB/POZ domain-containing protein 3-like [Eurytemora affinis]